MSEIVRLSELKPDRDNANLGTKRGREMLLQSIKRYGAGRSIVLDRNGRIIAGNKTVQAAIEAGLAEVEVVRTRGDRIVAVLRDDLDLEADPKARELAYADNRVSEVDLAWDLDQVRKDLERVDLSLMWNDHEIDMLLERAAEADQADIEDFDDVSEELPGAAALKPHMDFPSDLPYNIPALNADMLTALPQPIDIWAGPDASDPDDSEWWLYCYGSDSTKGLDLRRAVLAFYVDDYRFERWYAEPDVYVSKALNAGIPAIVSPNFSLWVDAPLALQIYNTFRARWLGRYIQEAGIPVIPDVNWSDERSFDFCFLGIPKGAPCVSVQIQTIYTEPEKRRQRNGIRRLIEELEPQSLLIYGGGWDSKQGVAGMLPDGLPVTWMQSRVQRRHDRVMVHGGFGHKTPDRETGAGES